MYHYTSSLDENPSGSHAMIEAAARAVEDLEEQEPAAAARAFIDAAARGDAVTCATMLDAGVVGRQQQWRTEWIRHGVWMWVCWVNVECMSRRIASQRWHPVAVTDVDAPDEKCATALMAAAAAGRSDTVELLCARGASVNHADRCGQTALMSAVEALRVDVAIQLLAAGADPNLVEMWGYSPLHTAAERTPGAAVLEMVRQLLSAGADVDATRSMESPVFDLETRNWQPAAVTSGRGWTALMEVSGSGK